jgi:hypothetical protein
MKVGRAHDHGTWNDPGKARAAHRTNKIHYRLADEHYLQSNSMSDTLVLNLALEEGPSTRKEPTKKGGRWTERCVGEPDMTRPAHYL